MAASCRLTMALAAVASTPAETPAETPVPEPAAARGSGTAAAAAVDSMRSKHARSFTALSSIGHDTLTRSSVVTIPWLLLGVFINNGLQPTPTHSLHHPHTSYCTRSALPITIHAHTAPHSPHVRSMCCVAGDAKTGSDHHRLPPQCAPHSTRRSILAPQPRSEHTHARPAAASCAEAGCTHTLTLTTLGCVQLQKPD